MLANSARYGQKSGAVLPAGWSHVAFTVPQTEIELFFQLMGYVDLRWITGKRLGRSALLR